jgi:hypothetical protein
MAGFDIESLVTKDKKNFKEQSKRGRPVSSKENLDQKVVVLFSKTQKDKLIKKIETTKFKSTGDYIRSLIEKEIKSF